MRGKGDTTESKKNFRALKQPFMKLDTTNFNKY